MADTVVVGKSVVRTDAAAKVRGGAVYGVDVRFGGMLVGKTLRAGVPHARIANLEISAAAKVPGVRAIVTGQDCSRRHGLFQKDQPALAIDRVRYAGEVVAAVAAEDEDAAQEAIERIAVDYEELPGVFDVMEAVAPGAALIHPDQMSYERAQVTGLVLNPVPDSNVSYHFKLRRGDAEAAWSQCDLVVEDTFSTQFVQYAHLEPHVTIALYDATGVLTLWTSTMGPHTVRDMLADLLRLPQQRVRVVITNMALALDGRRCRVARLAVGGVGASPIVLARAEQALEDQELDDATIARAADAAADEVEPMDDLQGSAEYRRDMLRVWVRRVVAGLAEGGAS